jgi:hypothetical protein
LGAGSQDAIVVGDSKMAKKIVPRHEPKVVQAKRGRGRPSLYLKEYARAAQRLAYLGATDKDLAIAFNTTITNIERWKAKHPDFGGALKIGKKEADGRVERSLYQRGVGYSYDAVKIFMPAGAKKPVIVPYVEHVPPDVTAQIFWLKNRDPAHWRDAWQVEHSMGKYIISDKPMDEATWIKERAKTIDVTPEPSKEDEE